MNTEPVMPATGWEGFTDLSRSRSSFKVKVERDEDCKIPGGEWEERILVEQ